MVEDLETASTGVAELDHALGGLYWGDNVVWEVEESGSVDPFVRAIAARASTDYDYAAYVTVTRRILENKGPAERSKVTRDIMEMARNARTKAGTGTDLTERERQALRYLDAVEKMQGTTVRRT